MTDTALPFDNQYVQLDPDFYTRQEPSPVSKPSWLARNTALAEELGISSQWLESEDALNAIAGNHVPAGADSIATTYAGHQFGQFNPQLGDGRAVLLGDLKTPRGNYVEMQLKGSGQTPYSRRGDGRAPLGPIIREYLVSEAMAALGVKTTRALAAVASGDTVYRDLAEPGGVICRIASSHIRVGTFEFFASRGQTNHIKALADYVIKRHYPACANSDSPYSALYESVVKAQAALIAHWQSLGFIHGVMNTDNMLVCGETVDYGPCAFIDEYKPNAVYSAIDQNGRYAFNNQRSIGHWNLAGFGGCLLPLLHEEQAEAVALAQPIIDAYPSLYNAEYYGRMSQKLGLDEHEDNAKMVDALLDVLTDAQLDYTHTLRTLANYADGNTDIESLPDALQPWLASWHKARATRASGAVLCDINPAIIPRNHLIQRAIDAAYNNNDIEPFSRLLSAFTRPFSPREDDAELLLGPNTDERVLRTFCGT